MIDSVPPFERTVDDPSIETSPFNTEVFKVKVTSVDGIDQKLPAAVYRPTEQRIPAGTVLLRGYAWSASNQPEYQRARTQYYSNALGMDIIDVDTPGQGIGSPKLTPEQKRQLLQRQPRDIGRIMVEAALTAYEQRVRKIGSLVIFGESQFPALAPWLINSVPEHIELSHVILYNPAGTTQTTPPQLALQLRKASKFFETYRDRSPKVLRAYNSKDTNVVMNIFRQPWPHIAYYPWFLSDAKMPTNLKTALNMRTKKPEVHIVSSELDLSSPGANQAAAAYLNAHHQIKWGHDHSYQEYVGAVAKELSDILK